MKRTFQVVAHITIEDSDENPAPLKEVTEAFEDMIHLDADSDIFGESAQIQCIEISWDTTREVLTKS